MLIKKTLITAQPYLDKIYHHPFQKGLRDGSLPREQFQYFIQQDDLYLHEFYNVLNLISRREANLHHKNQLQNLAHYIHRVERNLHHKYGKIIDAPYSPYFFNMRLKNRHKNAVIQGYTDYLNLKAKTAPLALAIASVTPCFYIYKKLGEQQNIKIEKNPYVKWLSSYSSPGFKTATDTIFMLYEHYGMKNPRLQPAMLHTFIVSTKYELAFLESCCRSNLHLFNFKKNYLTI